MAGSESGVLVVSLLLSESLLSRDSSFKVLIIVGFSIISRTFSGIGFGLSRIKGIYFTESERVLLLGSGNLCSSKGQDLRRKIRL